MRTLRYTSLILVFTWMAQAISQPVSAKTAPAPAKKVPVPSSPPSDPKINDDISELARLISKNDLLGVRVLVKKLGHEWPERGPWLKVRELLHNAPKVGWDVLRAWERIQPPNTNGTAHTQVDELVTSGNELLQQKKFESAFEVYQKAAKLVNQDTKPGKNDNRDLYYFILRQMSESLYGAGRFEDSLTVNLWIPPIYSDYKQILFERMWIAFRAGRIDVANGAIAGQYSSYFGVLEPESYLVQMYIYRKMCREDDYALVIKNLKNLQKKLKTGKFGITRWLKSDLQRRPYLSALNSKTFVSSSRVSDAERLAERKNLLRALYKVFEKDKLRLISEIDRVFAFARLALAASSKELPKIPELPPQTELLRSGLEMWPVSDGEDWLDELGQHIFIGDSQCKSQPPSSK